MRFTKLLMITVALSSFAFASSSYAKNLRCERYQEMGTEFFTNYAAYESWFPKTLSLKPEDFEKIPGRKSIQKSITTYEVNNPSSIKRRYVLTPSGKLTISSPTVSNASGRYKCNMTPTEVLEAAKNKKAKKIRIPKTVEQTKVQKCFSGELKECDDANICNRATSSRWVDDEKVVTWDTREQYATYVAEAEKRGLSCNGAEPQPSETSETGNQSNKVARAEEKCTSLGFTAGTEKHGDCVMKLLDY